MERPAFSFADSLAGNPIIAAVKEPEGLDRALDSDCGVIFLLCGDICTIGPLAARVSGRGKALFIHADLVDGLAGREVAVDFIRENTGAAGIISTKPSLIRRAREVGLSTVQRFFLIDSLALHNVRRLLAPEQRLILSLRVENDLSYTDIAAVLGVREGTVKSRLARARDQLRKKLSQSGNKAAAASSNPQKGGRGREL